MGRNMAYDLKHILSGFLTASMLLMLCNMIKTDHIDPLLGNFSVQPITPKNETKSSSDNGRHLISSDPWGLNSTKKVLNPCWRKSTNSKPGESRGLIFVTLAQDPEYHVSQIATAVVVAKYLGATLVVPNIIQSESGQKRMFGEIYDLDKFTASLDEKVRTQTMDSQFAEIPNQRVTTVRVPNKVSKEFVKSNIDPIFKTTRNLRLSVYFPSSMRHKRMNPYACLATFDNTLMLRPELQQSIDSMIGTLRSLNPRSAGRFVAVDYKAQTMPGSSSFDANEIASFMKRIGFENETTVYLTLNGWHTSIEQFRNIFPNTFTKDVIVPADEKSKFLDPGRPELKKIIDFYISSAADVYVPTSSNLFSDNVIARRIAATGKTQVLVPTNRSSRSAEDYIPLYISKDKHWAYSCFC